MSEPLPRLMDCRMLMAELNVKRASAEKIMRHVPKVRIGGSRKIFVRRADVAKYLEEQTAA